MKKTLLFTLMFGGLLALYSCTCNKDAQEVEEETTEQTEEATEEPAEETATTETQEEKVDLGTLSQKQYDDCNANLKAYYKFLVEYDKKLEENRLNASVLEKELNTHKQSLEGCDGSPTMKAMIERKEAEINASHAPGA